jgi:hypothetical protein
MGLRNLQNCQTTFQIHSRDTLSKSFEAEVPRRRPIAAA